MTSEAGDGANQRPEASSFGQRIRRDAPLPAPGRSPLPWLADVGYDRSFVESRLRLWGVLLRSVFRLRADGAERVDLSRPGILVQNHNWAAFGAIEGIALWYHWYIQNADRRPPRLAGQGGPASLNFASNRRMGIVQSSLKSMSEALARGDWVCITPGGETDQHRPLSQRNHARLKRVSWVGGRPVLSDQLSYVAVACEGGFPIHPVAYSGTHESAPILLESVWLLKLTRLHRVFPAMNWSAFPVTLNHVVNLVVFLLTPLASQPLAWVAFVLINVYVIPAYCYPILPIQLRLRIGEAIETPDLSGLRLPASERSRIYRSIHRQAVSRIDEMLAELDRDRPWSRAVRLLSRLTRRAADDVRSQALQRPEGEGR